MSALSVETGSQSLGSVALTWLNGAMSILCCCMALFVGALAAGALIIGISGATGWPQGGFNWSSAVGGMHVVPRTVTGTPDVCTTPAGGPACRTVSHSHLAPPVLDADALIFIFGFAIVVLPLIALVYGLVHAAGCFTALAQRRWFARRTITHLRDFALGGVVYLALQPLAIPFAKWLNTALGAWLLHSSTKAAYNVDLGPVPTMLTIVYATLLALITAVLAHARSVAEDHAQIV